MPTPPGIDPAELRRAGEQILDHVESAAAAFAENRAAMAKAGKNWGGESGQALRELVAHLERQHRELLASSRDIAHHMIRAGSVEPSDNDQVVEPKESK